MPNHEKAELKKLTLHDLGARLDDQLEAAERIVPALEGAGQSALALAKKLGMLMLHVQQDVEEGKYSIEVASHIKLYLERAVVVCESEAKAMALRTEQQKGIARGLKNAVDIAKRAYDEEDAKSKAPERTGPEGDTPEERRETRRAARAERRKPTAKKAPKKTTKKTTTTRRRTKKDA